MSFGSKIFLMPKTIQNTKDNEKYLEFFTNNFF